MPESKSVRVGVNGYGVIGKRVAAAVTLQPDMTLAGVSDVATDWRARMVIRNGFRLFGATAEHATAMHDAGLTLAGTLDDLLNEVDVVVDCTPKRVAAKNIEVYRRRGLKFILQGGEKHDATGHSFVAESNYASALDREATRVVSCNTTSIVRTLTALNGRQGPGDIGTPALLVGADDARGRQGGGARCLPDVVAHRIDQHGRRSGCAQHRQGTDG